MSDPILELGNAANWQSIWNFSDVVTPISGTNYYRPFPEIECPILLERHILACLVSSVDIKPHWRFGGWLNHKIRLGLTVGGSAEAYAFSPQKLWLNRITLIILPKLSSDLVVSFSIPYWLVDVGISLWEYTGIEGDSTESMLMDIESQLASIDSKL